ncbi:unnamed protein product [Sympodiomycopsis kandeliae]
MSSAAFKTLSMGVGSFDPSRFQSQVDLFNRHENKASQPDVPSSSAAAAAASTSALPAELDFFNTSNKGSNKGKSKQNDNEPAKDGSSAKKRKRGQADAVASVSKDILKSYLKQHRLNLTGTDYPLPLVSWAETSSRYNVPDWLTQELEERGWDLTGVQRGSMAVALEKRDVLTMAPTGSGKTIAYLLPLIHHLFNAKASNTTAATAGPKALILSPTRELATQIYNEARKLLSAAPQQKKGKGIRVALLTGKERLAAQEEGSPGGKGAKFDLLISTPLRLVNAVEVEGWSLANVTQVVLDEADTLLSETFLKQTDQILSFCTSTQLQKSLFSATLPSSIEILAKTFLSPDHVRLIVGSSNSSSSDVLQDLKFTGNEEGKLLELRSMIKMGSIKPPCLLFVQSIERAKDLYEELIYDGLRIDVIHSDRNRKERESVISSFKKGEIWILICTEVLSRGLDFKGVELVINYDFPISVESYIHRIGRTGRAGKSGSAISFFTKQDIDYLRPVLNLIKASNPDAIERLPQYLFNLPKVNKKDRKKLKNTTVTRQGVSQASGSRMVEIDNKEKISGKRMVDRKEMMDQSKKKSKKQKKTNMSAQKTKQDGGDEDSDVSSD